MIGQNFRGRVPQSLAPPARRQVSHEKVLEKIHGNLYSIVGEAVDDIKNEEEKWSRQEMVKRIVGYIFKAVKAPDLLTKPWQEVAQTVVSSGMASYHAACGDRTWFWQLGLGNAFTSAVWELLQVRSRGSAHYQDVQDFVVREFELHLDKTLLTKAVWDATSLTFNDDTIRAKVYKAVYNTYQSALDEMMIDTRPLDDARKVERFTKKWLEASMQRAWSSIEDAETSLTPGQVTRLFQNLMAPFGEGHEYSCIPIMFIENIGRPPRNWKYLKTAVNDMFRQWKEGAATTQPAKKRRKTAAPVENSAPEEDGAGIEADPEDVAEEVGVSNGTNGASRHEAMDEEPSKEVETKAEVDEEEEVDMPESGHPECTSAEECIGTPQMALVRHLLAQDDPGDVYCQACWAGFVADNPDLLGVWEDGDMAGEPYEAHAFNLVN
mmetsp:Transcript_32182/g.74214  ORF Transcript_32182/g.74214 Transcript_32182/m.74214 type:complete len:436 (+) Transcript_32182:32-1339(+)